MRQNVAICNFDIVEVSTVESFCVRIYVISANLSLRIVKIENILSPVSECKLITSGLFCFFEDYNEVI